MSPEEQERLDVISNALAQMVRRQNELEARLRDLEGHRAPPPLPIYAAPPEPQPKPPQQDPPPLQPPPPEREPPPSSPPVQEPPASPPPLETQLGLNWINRIAVVTLIFGVAFFFKYAVDANWIGPGTRIVLGLIAAVAALLSADRLYHRAQKIFAQGVTGLGIALLYLTFFAAFNIYRLIPQSAAFVLMTATTAAAAYLALRYESQAIAVLGLVGGYITPALLSTGEDHPTILFTYTFLLNLGALALARMRRWPGVEILAAAATLILYAGWFAAHFSDDTRTVAIVFLIAFFAEFAASESKFLWIFAQAMAAIGVIAVSTAAPDLLTLDFFIALIGLIVAALRLWPEAPVWALLCCDALFVTALHRNGFSFGTHGVADLPTFAWFTAIFALFFTWTGYWTLARKLRLRSAEYLVLAINGAAYFGASYVLLNPPFHQYMGIFAALLGGIHLLIAKLLWTPDVETQPSTEAAWPALLATCIALGFLTLAIPIQFAGFRITIGWALEGALLTWLASRLRNRNLQIAAFITLTLAFVRLFAFDSAIYPDGDHFTALINARFFTFTMTAASLWFAAWLTRPSVEAATAYLAGHFAMLWVLALEIIGWAERSAPAPDRWNFETTGISILMALYGLTLIAIGVVTRTAIHRLTGLALMALVVLKLYLSDIWELGVGFRITAFLGLGALLLLVSYLYSRFKPLIERLWKDDAIVEK